MSDFSEVSIAYSLNLKNLDEARQIFEKECKNLNAKILELLEEKCRERNSERTNPLFKKFSWGDVENASTMRQGHWLNFSQGTAASICIKPPGKARFDRNIASLNFEMMFDSEFNRYMFKIRFQNDYARNEQMDERLQALAAQYPDKFPKSSHVKSSSAILGTWDLDTDLVNHLEKIIDNCMNLVQEMVNFEFPDAEYVTESEETLGPSNANTAA